PEAALLCLFEERLRLHRNFIRPDEFAAVRTRAEHQSVGVRLNVCVNTLVGSGDQRIAFFNLGIDPAVAACPVGVLAEEADAPWHKELQARPPVRCEEVVSALNREL